MPRGKHLPEASGADRRCVWLSREPCGARGWTGPEEGSRCGKLWQWPGPSQFRALFKCIRLSQAHWSAHDSPDHPHNIASSC